MSAAAMPRLERADSQGYVIADPVSTGAYMFDENWLQAGVGTKEGDYRCAARLLISFFFFFKYDFFLGRRAFVPLGATLPCNSCGSLCVKCAGEGKTEVKHCINTGLGEFVFWA